MGRLLKRVPLDFKYPLNKTWEGYINPHYKKCPDCDSGQSASLSALEHLVHLILVAGQDSMGGRVHPWIQKAGIDDVGCILHELSSGLAGRKCEGLFGHDACDRWSATAKVVEAAGLPKDWGVCKTCGGDALDPTIAEAYNAWEDFDPPAGEGFQLWENTSEGSPVSPVFETLDQLCAWCTNNATTFGSSRATADQWRKMLDEGFVCHKEGNMIFI